MRGVENEFKNVSCYIDDLNLQATTLKLKEVLGKGFPAGSHALYRLKPAEESEPQVCHVLWLQTTSSFLFTATHIVLALTNYG